MSVVVVMSVDVVDVGGCGGCGGCRWMWVDVGARMLLKIDIR